MPDGQNKLDRPVIRSRENLWLELQKAREKMSVVDVLLLSLLQKADPPNYPDAKKEKPKTKTIRFHFVWCLLCSARPFVG